MNELQTSLSKCRVENNIVYLPTDFLPNYKEVREALLKAGATYKRNTFVFPNEAQPYINKLLNGNVINIKKEFQFFGTPQHLAAKMVRLSDINEYDLILEPSAGQGAIIKEIQKVCANTVNYCELMDINRNVLECISNTQYITDNFLKLQRSKTFTGLFHKIIANPPFNKNQDIEHIFQMWNCLAKGGRIVTIASKHWQYASGKIEQKFKNWLDEVNATIENIPEGEFKESGTNIQTCLIIIDKAA